MSHNSQTATAASVPETQPEIPIRNLRLRPWRPSDASQVLEAFNDKAIRAWHAPSVSTEDEATAWIAGWHDRWRAAMGAGWAITFASDPNIVLGHVALRALYLDAGLAECSYWVKPLHRGGSVAAYAVRALSDWAFQRLRLHRLEVRHSVRNHASCRVAMKAGFMPEGIERSLQRYAQGGLHDMHLHARARRADTRARLWDAAYLGAISHPVLWTILTLIGVISAFLGAAYGVALILPLLVVCSPLVLRLLATRSRLRRRRR